MNKIRFTHILALLAGMTLLTACGQEDQAAAPTDAAPADDAVTDATTEVSDEIKTQIEARQAQYKKIGGAFKTINDNLKSGSPDMAAIQAAAATVVDAGAGMADWFPEGTGPESGVKTEALPAIWENRADFDTKIAAFQAAAANLKTVADAGDPAAVGPAFGATGGTCKGCHDTFRLDD